MSFGWCNFLNQREQPYLPTMNSRRPVSTCKRAEKGEMKAGGEGGFTVGKSSETGTAAWP